MLLKQMLERPTTSSNLVVYDPFQAFDRETLVKEVVGLANAQIDGPRNILFGVNPGAMNGNAVVGIPEDAIGELKRAHRLVSALVEPVLELAFIFDRINGKLVGALEIDGCDFGPYFLAQDLTDELRRGACWIREDRDLRAIERSALLNGHAPALEEPTPELAPEDVSLSLGFNDDADCDFVEVEVPDTSDPPFAEDGGASSDTKRLTQAIKDTVSTVTTQMLRLAKPGSSPSQEPVDTEDAGKQIAEAARQHYFFEERAVKLDLCIRNNGDVSVRDIALELGMPRIPGLDIADRIYTSPFDKRSEAEIRKRRYADVEQRRDAVFVRTTIDLLPANKTQPVLGTALRMAVGRKALGRKVAMQYVLRAADGRRLKDGRLKIRLGQNPKGTSADGAAATHYRGLDDD